LAGQGPAGGEDQAMYWVHSSRSVLFKVVLDIPALGNHEPSLERTRREKQYSNHVLYPFEIAVFHAQHYTRKDGKCKIS
jgi:hypothetical protein